MTLTRTQHRIGDMSLLLVGIRSPDKAANERYAEVLTQKLRALPGHVVSLATYNVRDVRAFFDRNKWLYVAEDDLESIRDRLRTEINKRKNPLFVSLGDDEPIDSMQKRIGKRDTLEERFPGGLFTSSNGEYLWIAALPPGGLFVEHAGEGLFNAANRLLKENPPTAYHPQMHAEVAGPVATAVASRKAVEDDIKAVTVTCLLLVAVSIGLYFRQLRAIPLTGVPAVLGALVAFAVADLAFGYLNSSTAFLGSIILGNGINYAIVLMSRYEEQRARGDDPSVALREALVGCWRGTLVAAISASAAYASLMVTSFRGFYQFGVMGAVGALACWAATFTVLPAILVLLDRRQRPGHRRDARAAQPGSAGPLHSAVEHAAGAGADAGLDLLGVRAAALRPGPVRVRLPQAEREAQHHRRVAQASTTASTPSSAAGRRRRSCWPTPSTRSSRSAPPSASRTPTCRDPTSSVRSPRSTICCPARRICRSASWR